MYHIFYLYCIGRRIIIYIWISTLIIENGINNGKPRSSPFRKVNKKRKINIDNQTDKHLK